MPHAERFPFTRRTALQLAALALASVAGAAHADLFQIGEFESFLGCPDPVNRGQQAYVARAALRHLVAWAGGGPAAPSAPPAPSTATTRRSLMGAGSSISQRFGFGAARYRGRSGGAPTIVGQGSTPRNTGSDPRTPSRCRR